MRGFSPALATSGLLLLLSLGSAGCSVGPTRAAPNYRPVMSISARSPQPVEVRPFTGTPGPADSSKARKFFADAPVFVQKATADELAHAGHAVTRTGVSSSSFTAPTVSVDGTVEEFFTDQTMGGYDTHVRVRFRVSRGGSTLLDKQYEVREGGAGITATTSEYANIAQDALTKLMRKAIPDLLAAIDG